MDSSRMAHRRMNRRRFLQATALTAASSVIPGCSQTVLRPPIRSARNDCDLAPVIVSPDREIRTVVGLRPYRPSGFVVKAEKFGDKLVIHNYGHGGGGITLSWGTSQLATELLPAELPSAVAVIGSGAVGLATARLLQDRGLRVTIYASELPPNTTSNIAGGQWSPFDVFEVGKQSPFFMTQFLRATEFAYHRYQTLLGARYGIRWIKNYSLRHNAFDESDIEGMQSPIRQFMPEMRDLSDSEHPFSGYQYVRRFDTMLIEPPIYLNAMLTDFRAAGGAVRIVRFDDVTQVRQLTELIIFNCTGLGARALFDDQELIAIKGQLTVLIPQPEVNYLVEMEDDLYMFPRSDGIVLGGLFQQGEWSLSVDESARARVLNGHAQFFGSFRSCPRVDQRRLKSERAFGTNRIKLAV